MPLTFAPLCRSGCVLACLVFTCLALAACAFNVNNRDPSTDPPPMFDSWPGEPPAGMAQLLVVNPYIKDCCGASAGYIVQIAGEGVDFEYDDLMPTEDFFCANVPPGDYRVTLAFQTSSYAPASELAINVAAGDMRFLAADVDLRRDSYALDLRETDETSALRYVNRSMDRFATARSYRSGHESADTERIRAMNDERRQRQLQCVNLPEMNLAE